MAVELPFEKPLVELRLKIEELKRFTEERGIDMSEEVATLEAKSKALSESIYRDLQPWQKVQIARHPERPTTLDYIRDLCVDFVELHGDRNFRDDPAIVGGIGRFDGYPITVIGTQKGRDTKENLYRNFGMAHPEGYRKALRLMKQAEKFRRPVLCFIDTAGAYPGTGGEERGQGEAIARNLIEMAELTVPIVCIVTGEGGSGGALGLAIGDHLMMLEHAWYSVISPESAASILWKDASQAQRAADSMKITAQDLLRFGIVDEILPEPLGGAQRAPAEMIETVRMAVKRAFAQLRTLDTETLLAARYQKYRVIGAWTEDAGTIYEVPQAATTTASLDAEPTAASDTQELDDLAYVARKTTED
ncbi:MAG: acetyl-CoA carboxylase carboxyltransferase subunit alpha [Firmicutes bacterium]|nr:acetyl-CoA carboxylase carboxyltransferase subunit alpha [Bacillota bacterium]